MIVFTIYFVMKMFIDAFEIIAQFANLTFCFRIEFYSELTWLIIFSMMLTHLLKLLLNCEIKSIFIKLFINIFFEII